MAWTNDASDSEISCLFSKAPSILAFFKSAGWDTSAGNYRRIVDEWCRNDTLDVAVKRGYTGLDQYLKALSCRTSTGAPDETPGTGTPTPGTDPGQDIMDQVMSWAKSNPILAAAGAFGLFMLLRGGRR